ncbi:MAG: hypothetical protein U9P38_06825 [Campylobacterota bacterium]|nr:hypothetical protein [Campylobacterota bacterium]
MSSFIFLEHFFQFFLLLLLLGYGVMMFIVKGIVVKYPEILKDSLSIFTIVTYPFKHKHEHLDKAHQHIDKANDKYDEYENRYDDFVYKLFYPIPLVLALSSSGGYLFYFLTKIESSIIFNIVSLVVIYIVAKRFKKD